MWETQRSQVLNERCVTALYNLNYFFFSKIKKQRWSCEWWHFLIYFAVKLKHGSLPSLLPSQKALILNVHTAVILDICVRKKEGKSVRGQNTFQVLFSYLPLLNIDAHLEAKSMVIIIIKAIYKEDALTLEKFCTYLNPVAFSAIAFPKSSALA